MATNYENSRGYLCQMLGVDLRGLDDAIRALDIAPSTVTDGLERFDAEATQRLADYFRQQT